LRRRDRQVLEIEFIKASRWGSHIKENVLLQDLTPDAHGLWIKKQGLTPGFLTARAANCSLSLVIYTTYKLFGSTNFRKEELRKESASSTKS
jgi:hypothetical protein